MHSCLSVFTADLGEVIFKGRIRIPARAAHTVSDTRVRGIMLGRRARIQAMPTNEVGSDMSDCAHGVAIADLDENSMFYLAARGVDRNVARASLMTGFVFNVLDQFVMDAPYKARVSEQLQSLLPTNETEINMDHVLQKMISI